MDKCRICLKCSSNMLSMYDLHGELSYLDMVNFVAARKIVLKDHVYKICSWCRKKLIEAYDFKILIERSDMNFCINNNIKRIMFSNLSDVMFEIEIKPKIKKIEDTYLIEFVKDGGTCILYNDVEIKKVSYSDEKENEPLPVLDFLKSIHTVSDNEYDSENYLGEYCVGSDTDEYLPLKPNKKKKSKKKYTKVYKNVDSNGMCIKPVYLENVRVMYNDPTQVKKKYKYPKKKTICPYCGKFTSTLKSHLLVHTAERSFKCEICEKGFFCEKYLNVHLQKHITERNFKCDQCVAAFKNKAALKSHMLKHSDEKKFICDVCSKGFKKKHALLRHVQIHILGKKKIKCELCEMTFHVKAALRHHMRVHTRERPYNCEICSQPYSYKHDFNRHCFKKHGVFLKRRSVNVMNEEVMMREKLLMRNLMLKAQGLLQDDMPENPFEGPQAALALEQALKAIASNQISFDF